ncbi:MAG TPA: multiheme c-type cytochrome [Pyrinomonadaceae bacterium]|nr:multiheme c-type cytochrome [Pyrinomonadaceae bacterium]
MNSHIIKKHALSSIVVILCLLIFGLGFSVFNQTNSSQSWHPRRVPVDADFIGDKACAECHKKMVSTQALTSMGMAMEPVSDSKVLNDNPRMTFRSGPYNYEIKRQGKQSIYTVTDGKDAISLPILYAFGQGKAGQTYLLQYGGAYYESLVSYYREIGGLDFTIGAPRGVPESLVKAVGRRLGETETGNCFACHSTGGIRSGKIYPDKMVPGIRCEGCHGPAGAHVDAARQGESGRKLVFNPATMGGDELSQEFCAACHRGSDEFGLLSSMEINNVRFQPYRIFHSKCYSDDRRIGCTACHNPHEPLTQDMAAYDKKCLACHATKDKPAAVKSEAGSQSLAVACKVATKDCVSCHMPKIGPPAAHFKFTDHYIRIVKPKETYPS